MSLQDTIFSLEQSLLHSDWSDQPAALEEQFGENFQEINPLGAVVSRQEVMQWLLQKDPAHRWEITKQPDYRCHSHGQDGDCRNISL